MPKTSPNDGSPSVLTADLSPLPPCHILRHLGVDAAGDPGAEERSGRDRAGQADQAAEEDHASQVGAYELCHGDGPRRGRDKGVGHGQAGQQRDAVEQQRAAGLARQRIDQRHQDDEPDIKEHRDCHQEAGEGHGPRRAFAAEDAQQREREAFGTARDFQKLAKHGAQAHHHRDKAQRAAHALFNAGHDRFGRHARRQGGSHADQQQ